jgi:hypothetical protein
MWGLIDMPLAQITGSGFSATIKHLSGPWASLLQRETISHGPTRSSSSSPGKIRNAKFISHLQLPRKHLTGSKKRFELSKENLDISPSLKASVQTGEVKPCMSYWFKTETWTNDVT